MTREDLMDRYPEETFLLADGFDDAMRVIYSVKKCIEILMEQSMNYEEAQDYFNFNVRGSYMGDQTPIWCDDIL